VSVTDLALLVYLGAVWGAAFLFFRVAAPEMGPLWTAEIRVAIAGLALGFGAVVFLLGGAHVEITTAALLAVAAGLGAALSYAVYLVYAGEEVRRLGAMRLTGLATSVACLLSIGQFLLLRPLGMVAALPAEVLGLSVLNATLCTFAPVVMLMLAIERIGPAMTAQAGMIGPLATIALGVLLLGEPFSMGLVAGTALVLLGIALLDKRR
jgi:drug/metabolite transporter (DMT)-like permease